MDTLAGYGSDSDTSSLHPSEGPAQRQHSPLGGAFEGLIGEAGSDSDEVQDDNDEAQHGVRSNKMPAKNHSNSLPQPPPSLPSKKRQREEKDQTTSRRCFLTENYLPKPMLKSTCELSYWSVDYLSSCPLRAEPTSCNLMELESTKFQKLAELLPSSKSWAEHLREQQEFHNPHFFQSVLEYFGIPEPLGGHVGEEKCAQSFAIEPKAIESNL